MAVTFQSFDVCVLKDFEFQNNKEYTLGNSKWNPYKSQLQYMNSNNRNITFKNVNYEGSANVVAALVNKEINIGIVLLQSAASSIEAGTIKCLYSTGSKNMDNSFFTILQVKVLLQNYNWAQCFLCVI